MKKRKDIAEELQQIIPGSTWPAETPGYGVPDGYFEQLPGQIMQQIHAQQSAAVAEELDEMGPFLSQMPKQHPYAVPEGYFDTVPGQIMAAIPAANTAKVIPMPAGKGYWKWAVAASVTALIAISTLFFVTSNSTSSMEAQLAAISDQEMMDYLHTYTDDSDPIFANVSLPTSIRQEQYLTDDVPTSAIEQYLENSDLLSEVPSNE
jgi:hypothetical protein